MHRSPRTTHRLLIASLCLAAALQPLRGARAVLSLTVSAPTLVTRTSATFHVSITATGAANPQVWLYYGFTNGQTNASAWLCTNSLGVHGAGDIATNIATLQSGSSYWYTARASNSAAQAWATPSSFQTVTTPAPSTAIGVTGTPVYVESDPVWSAASGAVLLTNGSRQASSLDLAADPAGGGPVRLYTLWDPIWGKGGLVVANSPGSLITNRTYINVGVVLADELWSAVSASTPYQCVNYRCMAAYLPASLTNGAVAEAALGDGANGTNYGVALGRAARGQNYGAAIGNYAYGDWYGVAIGSGSLGNDWGAAIGIGADGHGTGNVAIGYIATVPEGFKDTYELGTGTAVSNGWFHFRGYPVIDPTGGLHSTGADLRGGDLLNVRDIGASNAPAREIYLGTNSLHLGSSALNKATLDALTPLPPAVSAHTTTLTAHDSRLTRAEQNLILNSWTDLTRGMLDYGGYVGMYVDSFVDASGIAFLNGINRVTEGTGAPYYQSSSQVSAGSAIYTVDIGTSSIVRFPAACWPSSGNVTLSFWYCRITPQGGGGGYSEGFQLDRDGDGNHRVSFRMCVSGGDVGDVRFFTDDYGVDVSGGAYGQPTGTWNFAAITWKVNECKLYVNGTNLATDSSCSAPPTDGSAFVGRHFGRSVGYPTDAKLLGEFSTWNRILTASEIITAYQNGAAGEHGDVSLVPWNSGLVSLFKFDEAAGTNMVDQAARVATIEGGAAAWAVSPMGGAVSVDNATLQSILFPLSTPPAKISTLWMIDATTGHLEFGTNILAYCSRSGTNWETMALSLVTTSSGHSVVSGICSNLTGAGANLQWMLSTTNNLPVKIYRAAIMGDE